MATAASIRIATLNAAASLRLLVLVLALLLLGIRLGGPVI
jgi:hypothetical protein